MSSRIPPIARVLTVAIGVLLLLGLLHGNGRWVHQRLLVTGAAVWPDYLAWSTRLAEPPHPQGESCRCPEDGREENSTGAPGAPPATEAAGASAGSAEEDEGDDEEEDTEEDEFSLPPVPPTPPPCYTYCKRIEAWTAAREEVPFALGLWLWLDRMAYQAVDFGDRHRADLLVALLLCGALAAAIRREHISLRTVRSRLDDRTQGIVQLLGNALMLWAWIQWWRVPDSGNPLQSATFIAIFALQMIVNLRHALMPEGEATGARTRSPLTVPLFTMMGIIAGIYFLVGLGQDAKLAIYMRSMTLAPFDGTYLQIALYVWVGMLLKQSRLSQRVFDVMRPWRLPPEAAAFLIIVVGAIPTAYSGASGIFVIAAGALIYREMRRLGAEPTLAVAVTAMSGSLGVVLRPCLLIVIIALLDQNVTQSVLYGWGGWIYMLTALLTGIALAIRLWARGGRFVMATPGEAWRPFLAALGTLWPYFALLGGVFLAYVLILGQWLDETSAPYVLPVAMMALLAYDSFEERREAARAKTPSSAPQATSAAQSSESDGEPATAEAPVDRANGTHPVGEEDEEHPYSPHIDRGFWAKLHHATLDTAPLIGALLALMTLSTCLGGAIQESEIIRIVPENLGGPWVATALLVVVLVIVGMIMDPYGAVILVNAVLSDIAQANGIDRTHFWMMVLVAFELGYLTPPVALNQILARHVAGREAELYEAQVTGFWRRNEAVLLPLIVMLLALLIVSFGPLVFGVGAAPGAPTPSH